MTLAAIIYLLSLVANQMLLAHGQQTLSTEQKASVSDASLSKRPLFTITLVVFFGLYMFINDRISYSRWMLPLFMALVFLLGLGFAVVSLRRLHLLDLPASYIRNAWIGLAITQVSFLALIASMLYDFTSPVPL